MSHPARFKRWAGWALLALALALTYQQLGLGRWLTFDQLKASQAALVLHQQNHPVWTLTAYFALYVLSAALSVPGAAILTLAGGAIFGFWVGLLVVSMASSVGALLAFWVARRLLRQQVQKRWAAALASINAGLAQDGAFYLLSLRLLPVLPFWLVNLLMGLTHIEARTFYLASQVGMLPATAIYVNAGTELAAMHSTADIVSPGLWGSLLLLGAFPMIVKAILSALRTRKLNARWPKPRHFDRNLVVLGAGAGGLVTAYIGAALKARVTLIEAHKMGGDCLNYGCVPSKALIRSAKAVQQLRMAQALGLAQAHATVDFAAVMQRVRRVIADVAPHDSVERYTALGVEVLHAQARITSPWTVELRLADGQLQTLSTRAIVIATGARPFVPPIPGLQETGYLTSDTVWDLTEQPRRLVVLGGGPIGCELAQSFARLGSQVTQVEMAPRLLVREDPEVSDRVSAALRADGVCVCTGHQALRVEQQAGEKRLIVTHTGVELTLPFDALLCAVGRSPRVSGLGLEELGIALNANKTIPTNAYLQTLYPNIYAVGDVAGPYQFTHTAGHQAWYAAVNALLGRFKKFKVDYSVVPWTTFTDPEVARVGLSETDAQAQGVAYELTRYDLADLDRAITDEAAHGFVKVLTVPGCDKILGVTLVGEHAGDLLAEFVLAMRHGLGLNKILATIHPYPTWAEANKYAAGVWKRAHAPQRLLAWLARYQAWERA